MSAAHDCRSALLRVARHEQHPWSANLLVESLVTQAAAVWATASDRPG